MCLSLFGLIGVEKEGFPSGLQTRVSDLTTRSGPERESPDLIAVDLIDKAECIKADSRLFETDPRPFETDSRPFEVAFWLCPTPPCFHTPLNGSPRYAGEGGSEEFIAHTTGSGN